MLIVFTITTLDEALNFLFAEFAFKIASNDKEIKDIEEMLSSLTKQQKDFAIRDDIVYIILKNLYF